MTSPPSTLCLFVSDLHGRATRYEKLVNTIRDERPGYVFLGGDLLPAWMLDPDTRDDPDGDFLGRVIRAPLRQLRNGLKDGYPRIFLIMGNDDPRSAESELAEGEDEKLWEYVHGRGVTAGGYTVIGYNCVPPTPFMLKDWERYDVSRYVDPGCIPPEEGRRTSDVLAREIRNSTIASDLGRLAEGIDMGRTICLFHSPPYKTTLDVADLKGKLVDHAPLDVHIGSIAIRRFLESHQPLISLHGHVHESCRLTGEWNDSIGGTVCLSAAHDGPELALIRFDLENPSRATRELV